MNTADTRRDFIKKLGLGAATTAISANSCESGNAKGNKAQLIEVNPEPKFDLSPYLYMQFMEPLGTTDGSVAAAWDFPRDCWREDVLEATQKLSPTLLRWGGIFCSYYLWKEAIGPRHLRKPMINLLWGGIESNQVGTHEFVDFCRQVGAGPLICVNFESEGKKRWAVSPKGDIRSAGSQEAREWVDYCNNPSNPDRLKHGVKEPYNVRLWQLGNETSYGKGGFDCETAATKTVEFARAMRKADPSIQLIGWGDSGWAEKMIEIAGGEIQYIAFHNMFNPYRDIKDSPLKGIEYRKDPARTWEYLMNAYKVHQTKINKMREQVSGTNIPLALTECHFSLPGRNRCEVLSTWAAGVSYARLMNVHERNGDILKIATLADFCGTRWQVNAIMIPVPGGRSFMMPVARIMCLYRHHTGEKGLTVSSSPPELDVTAGRTGNRVFLHVINTDRTASVKTQLAVEKMKIISGQVFELAADPMFEIMALTREELTEKEKPIPQDGAWSFPPASVSAIELEVQQT